MMITRKRLRNPQSPATNPSSKRLRRSSSANNKSTEIVDDLLISQDRLSSDSYPVRAILAENSDEYLVDWEDDLITGETFSPTWVRGLSFYRASLQNISIMQHSVSLSPKKRVHFALRANPEH